MFFRDTDFQEVDNEIEEAIAARARFDAPRAVPEQTIPISPAPPKSRATSFYATGHKSLTSADDLTLPVVSPSDRLVSADKRLTPNGTTLSVIHAMAPVLLVYTALRCFLPSDLAGSLTAFVIYITSYAVPAVYDVTEIRRALTVLAIFNALLQGQFSGLAVSSAAFVLGIEATRSAFIWWKGRKA